MNSKKKLIRTVKLKFFQDDANGEFGLTHDDTIANDNGFNAFWDGRGIFHDVFEHAHEHSKYFRGQYAMNVGGEIAAMGALWYFVDKCDMHDRLINPFLGYQNHASSDIIIDSTANMMQESITDGYCNFGDTLESNVPHQKETDNSELEHVILAHYAKLQKTEVSEEEGAKEYAQAYKDSCTLEKIADLYRYGYRMASRLVPEDYHNGEVMNEFMRVWNKFCKNNPAEELSTQYRGITFRIYKDAENMISWKAVFEKDRFAEDVETLVMRG